MRGIGRMISGGFARFSRDLGAFRRAPASRRGLVLEAVKALVRARLVTLGPTRKYAHHLGEMSNDAADGAVLPVADPAAADIAAEIGRVVERTARWMPFRARCLQQAVATRRMLAARGLPATVFLGVNRDAAARRSGDRSAAHAWVTSGGRVVAGDVPGLAGFVVVGRFV